MTQPILEVDKASSKTDSYVVLAIPTDAGPSILHGFQAKRNSL